MIIPVDVTLEQLRALSKTQIINKLSTWLTNNFTKRQLILWLMDIEVMETPAVRTYRTDGQVEYESVTMVDTEMNKHVSRRETTWLYYPTGEVDTITIKHYDSSDALIRTKAIKHYTNGKQPTVTEA